MSHLLKAFMLVVTGVCMTCTLYAQKSTKAEKLVYDLSESGILTRYHQCRREAEKYVKLFKLQEDSISQADVVEMEYAYAATAESFEAYLRAIRNDLLDGKKRRQIRKNEEVYVTAQLQTLDSLYQHQFMGEFFPTYARICAPQLTSKRVSPLPIIGSLVAPITSATVRLLAYLDDKAAGKKEAYKELLQTEWIEPNLFPEWQQI
ncbi:MAG: hypothetical protein AAGI38_00245 [Bacteroidota bacterium]